MSCYPIRVHLVRLQGNQSDVPESFLIDFIHFTVDLVREFIQKTVDDFIECHQHLRGHLKPRRLTFDEAVTVHRNVKSFDRLLASIRADGGHHVCFLSGEKGAVASSFFEHGMTVISLPKLPNHYTELLSHGSADELRSLGLGVGAALHEIGHLLGAFHSIRGIMSQQPNALRLFHDSLDDSTTDSVAPPCFFDKFSTCLFAHGPFFNSSDIPARPLSVHYRTTEEAVHIKCIHGILLVVIVKGTTYHDLKVYDDLPATVTLQIKEELWDLIQVYNAFHHVENIPK